MDKLLINLNQEKETAETAKSEMETRAVAAEQKADTLQQLLLTTKATHMQQLAAVASTSLTSLTSSISHGSAASPFVPAAPYSTQVSFADHEQFWQDKMRRKADLVQQLRRELEYIRSQRDTYENTLKLYEIKLPPSPMPIVPVIDVISPPPLLTQAPYPHVFAPNPADQCYVNSSSSSRSYIPNAPRQSHEYKTVSVITSDASTSAIAVIPQSSVPTSTNGVASPAVPLATHGMVIVDPQKSQIHGYCSSCEKAVPVRVARRCNRCHTENIADAKDGSWTELNGQYNNCVHTKSTKVSFIYSIRQLVNLLIMYFL